MYFLSYIYYLLEMIKGEKCIFLGLAECSDYDNECGGMFILIFIFLWALGFFVCFIIEMNKNANTFLYERISSEVHFAIDFL